MCRTAGEPSPRVRARASENAVGRVAHAMLIRFAMKDLLFVALTGGFFVVTWLYAKALDHL